jgi:hypothetical protein
MLKVLYLPLAMIILLPAVIYLVPLPLALHVISFNVSDKSVGASNLYGIKLVMTAPYFKCLFVFYVPIFECLQLIHRSLSKVPLSMSVGVCNS